MGKMSFEERVDAIIQAVSRASPADSSLGVARTGSDDGLDRLAGSIDDLMRRFQERMEASRMAQEALLKLRIPGAPGQEEPSREQLLLLSTLEENAPDTIWFKDTQGRFLHLSKARVKAFDLVSTDEVVGMTDFDFFTEEHARAAFEDERRILRTGEPIVNKEEKETWLDRPPTWVMTTRMPLRDRAGTIVGTCGIARNITERKRAEERYRLLFNSINDSAFVTELTPDGGPGRIIDMNEIACEAMERPREEVVGANAMDFLAPEGAEMAAQVSSRLKNSRHAVWESVYVTRTSQRIPVEISSRLLDLAGDRVILSTVRDLSARRKLEENLQRERALLATLIDNLPDYVSVKDTQSRVLVTNPANARTMGIENPQDAVGRTDLDFFPPEEAARYLADERAVVRTGEPLINKEEESTAPDGSPRWTLTSKVPLRDAQGNIIGMVCTGRDITELKQAELALRQEAIRRRILFEEASDGIVVLDRDLKVVEANGSFAEMLGYSREEVLSLRPWNWDADSPTEQQFAAAWPAAPKERVSIVTRHRRKDGSVFDVEISVNPALLSGEYQVYCACRDITERKQAEERIHDLARFTDESPYPVMRATPQGSILYANQSAHRLLPSWEWAPGLSTVPDPLVPEIAEIWAANETRRTETRDGSAVVELTLMPIPSRGYVNIYGRDVTEEKSLAEKFLQAQKMEAIGRFAGGIAHDFNNLLTVISGYCDLAQAELPEDGPARKKIDQISRATRKAAALTGRLLAFSRKQVLVPRVLDLNELVRAEESTLARLVGEDIQVRTLLRSEAGATKADPGQIELVLMNLAINARDAMPRGGRLALETSRRILDDEYARGHPDLVAGDYACLSVSDTGHGMDRETLSHVFEPFFTTKEPGRGTGLGLSTVYGIVKQSGGHITCYSEPGTGTTFTIYFPRTVEPSEQGAVPVVDSAALRGTETLMLVEDEEMVRGMTTQILENSGYTVIAAPGGAEALAMMESHEGEIALAITDVVMPVMNGKDLAERLLHARPSLKVLFVSGYSGDAIIQGMLGPGVDFIQKPFASRELLAKIREILARA